MPIHVSVNLRQWLNNKGLQGYLKVADSEPHPRATEVIQSIDITKLTKKRVCHVLNLKREDFDVVQKMDNDMLWSYFGEPSAKAY